MATAKIALLSDIRKQIEAPTAFLFENGLELSFTYEGRDYDKKLSPEHSCILLKQAGVINDDRGEGEGLQVEIEMEVLNDTRLVWASWEQFVSSADPISLYHSLELAARYIDAEQCKREVAKIRQIQPLIQSFA